MPSGFSIRYSCPQLDPVLFRAVRRSFGLTSAMSGENQLDSTSFNKNYQVLKQTADWVNRTTHLGASPSGNGPGSVCPQYERTLIDECDA
jgi:hypothetical protein